MESEITSLSLNDIFRFSCSSEVPCFNECCKDMNQFLTPYDILRLKNRLEISSTSFIKQYTTQHMGPESGLPIITFKISENFEFKCPFNKPSGCSVYEDRPGACRSYPLARMAYRSKETGSISDQYMLLQEPHCKGFCEEKTQSVQEWIEYQEIAIYNEMNDLMMEIINLKNRIMPDRMDCQSRQIFHLACYDLDAFRFQIFEKEILDELNLEPKIIDSVRHDDNVLLKLGLEWVKFKVFGKKTVTYSSLEAV